MSEKETFIGWAELYSVNGETETLITKGKGSWGRSVEKKERVAPYGKTLSVSRVVEGKVTESASIETDEFTTALVNIQCGLAIGTDLTTPQAMGTGALHDSNLLLKLFDMESDVTPRITRAGFGGMLSIDGEVSVNKDDFASAKVKVEFEGAVGTITRAATV